MKTITPTNVAFPGAVPELLRRCEQALDLMLTHRGDPSSEIERVLAEDPGFVFAHCLRAALIVRADADAARPALAESLAAIEAACPDMNDPACRHAAAARAWLDGNQALASERYGTIVVDRPRDVLALMVAHALDFRLGRRPMLRDRVAQVLPEWKPATPGYASVLAMYAFGLEENGQYRRAEKLARRALTLDPRHPGAIHVIAHVMEMQGRARGPRVPCRDRAGLDRGHWFLSPSGMDRALFHLDADDPDAALAVYDTMIAKGSGLDMSVLADASALLWRLRLRGIEVGERWRPLADRWEAHSLAGARPFYVVHALIAFASTGRSAATVVALQALRHADPVGTALSLPEEALAQPLCEALLAFASGDYASCVKSLTRVRHIAHRCGGSLAQCDLIHLTLTEAALRARKAQLARALVSERAAQKPASRLNRRLQQRLQTMPAVA